MIYLDYAKAVAGGYILNFFADTEEDIAEVSNGKHFITKNGIDYGVPQPSSTIVITMPDKTKKTYVLNEAGEWQEGGVDMDYSKLTNAPITLANLAEEGFEPEANTYYEHLGETTEDFIKGIIYLYDGKEYKAIDGSGSGAGVQADYNQNDSAAADYIKNRPFYDATVALFDENITTNMPEGVTIYIWETTSKNITANIGDEVKVIFNGVEYTQTVKDYDGVLIYVGNASIIELGEDTKEPFFISLNLAFYSSETQGKPITGIMVATKTAYNGEVKIIANGVKTIDPKFIKDMYYETTVETGTLLEQTFTTQPDTEEPTLNVWETTDSKISFVEGETIKVLFNGTKYTLTVKKDYGSVLYIGNIYIFDKDKENTGEPFAVANTALSTLKDGTTIITEQPQTNATIKVYKSEDIIKTIDHKYIKDMYYSTEAFTPFIDFKVISGDINTIGSTMVVQYGGKEYTETVKDAAEQGSSTHKPYIGFEMGDAPSPTEEQPFCYGVNLLFEGNTKQLFCAAPKTVSENEAIIYNGENKTVKKMTVEGLSFLYVGNIHLISEDFEDTGEQYLTLFDYFSVATQGKVDLVASIVPQDGISCEVKGENISYINPKYIKDMYYTKPESDIQKILVFKGEIRLNEEVSSPFEVGDIVSLKEEAVGLDVIDEAKSVEVNNETVAYIGNLSLLAALLEITGAVDTKEDYCALCGYSNGSPSLLYYNKNSEMPNNIEVYKSADPIVRIPEKYLPLDIAKKSYVDTAISNAITKTLNTEV